jgi:LemA protein
MEKWLIPLLIIVGIILIIAIWFITTRNKFVLKKNYIKEAWSSIDVQLKRKANVIPNLVDLLKMQTNFEKETLEKLTAARSGMLAGSNDERMRANDEASKLLRSFYAVSESYPTLGSNPSFIKVMEEVKDCEDKVTYSRTRYNMTVTDYNNYLQMFPSNIVGNMMGLKPEKIYEISETLRESADNIRISEL